MAKGKAIVSVDPKPFADFRKRLEAAGQAMPAELDNGLKTYAQLVAAVTKRNFGWSRRIPRTVRVVKSKQNNWTVTAGGPTAPHTRPWDPASGKAVRAPSWPRGKDRTKWTWHKLPHRPGMHDALRTTQDKGLALVAASVDKALEKAKK
jgi:hypothetical protein